MASAWAQLSKDDQAAWSATGMTKSEYNQKYGKGGETAPPPPKAPTPSPTPAPTPEPTPAPTPTASPEPSYSTSMMASSRDEPVTGPTFEPASSNEEPNRSTAVDKSKTWADLSKDERAATGMTKKEYNRQGYGSRIDQDPGTASTMDFVDSDGDGIDDRDQKRPGGKAIIDPMPEMQIDVGTQGVSDFSELSKDSREALTSTGVTKKEYNRRVGDGSVSKFDIKQDVKSGADLAELTRLQESGTVTDAAAQKYLSKKIKQLTPSQEVLPEIDDTELIETPGVNTGGTGGSVDTGDTGSNNDSTNTIEIGGGNPGVGGGGQNPGVGGGGQNPGGSNNGSVDNSFNETINQIQDVDITQGNNQTFNVEQNNDLNSVITGDNNISNIEQNNSVSNIGGEQSNTANVTGSSANTSASGFLNNYLSQLPALQNFYAAGGSFEGGSNSSSTTSSSIPASTYTSPSSYYSPYTNTQNSYNDLINQTQDVDVAETNDQNFNVTQDNDLNSQIIGDNNVSNITQDNSVRNYGGDQRNFTYVSGSSANGTPTYLTDNLASAATMAGYYAPNDSPASNAAFVDQYQTMNADAQKKYDPFGTAEGYIARGKNVGNMDMSVVNQMNLLRPELSYARADMANLNTYGDQYSAPGLKWNSALGTYEPIDAYDPEAIAEQAQNMFK
jgi:hypothetical protein